MAPPHPDLHRVQEPQEAVLVRSGAGPQMAGGTLMSDAAAAEPEKSPETTGGQRPRPHVRRRTEQDPVLDNLVWLQRTREQRLADARRTQ